MVLGSAGGARVYTAVPKGHRCRLSRPWRERPKMSPVSRAHKHSAPPALVPNCPEQSQENERSSGDNRGSPSGHPWTIRQRHGRSKWRKLTAEVRAACTGRAVGDFRNTKLVASVRPKGILGHELLGHFLCELRVDTALNVDVGKLLPLERHVLPSRVPGGLALSVSDWELTDTYSPAAIDIAPATSPATPASRMSPCFDAAAATPTMRLAVETIARSERRLSTSLSAALGHFSECVRSLLMPPPARC